MNKVAKINGTYFFEFADFDFIQIVQCFRTDTNNHLLNNANLERLFVLLSGA